jgi:hypothetical protein
MYLHILKILRLINNKTFKIRFFKIPTVIRTKIQTYFFHFFPKYSYLFSLKKNRFPIKDERIKKTENVLDDIIILDNQTFFDEVNLIFRGYAPYIDNANEKMKIFSKKKNVFLVNFSLLKNKNIPENQNYYYPELGEKHRVLFTPDFPVLHLSCGPEVFSCMDKNQPFIYIQKYILKNGKLNISGVNNINDDIIENEKINKIKEYVKHNKTCKFIKFYFKSPHNFRTGSGINAALVLSKISKKLNIYGWNFFLEESPKTFNYWKALNLFSPIKYKINNPAFFERFVIHCLYSNRLRELKHVSQYGYLNDFSIYHPRLSKMCEQAFYNKDNFNT